MNIKEKTFPLEDCINCVWGQIGDMKILMLFPNISKISSGLELIFCGKICGTSTISIITIKYINWLRRFAEVFPTKNDIINPTNREIENKNNKKPIADKMTKNIFAPSVTRYRMIIEKTAEPAIPDIIKLSIDAEKKIVDLFMGMDKSRVIISLSYNDVIISGANCRIKSAEDIRKAGANKRSSKVQLKFIPSWDKGMLRSTLFNEKIIVGTIATIKITGTKKYPNNIEATLGRTIWPFLFRLGRALFLYENLRRSIKSFIFYFYPLLWNKIFSAFFIFLKFPN